MKFIDFVNLPQHSRIIRSIHYRILKLYENNYLDGNDGHFDIIIPFKEVDINNDIDFLDDINEQDYFVNAYIDDSSFFRFRLIIDAFDDIINEVFTIRIHSAISELIELDYAFVKINYESHFGYDCFSELGSSEDRISWNISKWKNDDLLFKLLEVAQFPLLTRIILNDLIDVELKEKYSVEKTDDDYFPIITLSTKDKDSFSSYAVVVSMDSWDEMTELKINKEICDNINQFTSCQISVDLDIDTWYEIALLNHDLRKEISLL